VVAGSDIDMGSSFRREFYQDRIAENVA
jgi:hypothetical protein